MARLLTRSIHQDITASGCHAIFVREFAAFWARNLLDTDYIQNLTVQAGDSGLIVGTPSDPRSVGVTLRRLSEGTTTD